MELRKERGITLVVLVVAIIVILILVGVGVGIAIKGGVFKKEEATDGVIVAESSKQNSASVQKTEKGTSKEGWYEKSDGVFTNGKYTVEIGDYINYKCWNDEIDADNLTYTSTAGKKGDSQVFRVTLASNSMRWQVLGVENGNLLITSEKSLGKLTLSGADGYNNGVSELNNICAIYGHGKNASSARSINIDDVNKITGYDPTTAEDGKPYDYGTVGQYKNGPVTYKQIENSVTYTYGNNQVGTFYWSSSPLRDVGATEDSTILTIPECTGYSYSVFGDQEKFFLLFGNRGGYTEDYWLASSYVYTSDRNIDWGLNYAHPGGIGRCQTVE